MRDFAALHAHSSKAGVTQRTLRGILLGVTFSVAAVGAEQGRAESWVDIPGAEECRVDTDSTAYDSQADVVAFRYQCTGAGISSIAVACNDNQSWRATGAASSTATYRDWLTEWLTGLFRAPTRVVAPPVSGTYTDPIPIERGTPIGRGRQFVCASKDRYKEFKFTGVR